MHMRTLIAGTGNVATRLALALRDVGAPPVGIWGRREVAARELAERVGAVALADWMETDFEVDLVVLAVADSAIGEVAGLLAHAVEPLENPPLVVHTSGATPATVLAERGIRRFGVAWPVQSLRKEKPVSFTEVPLCIWASDGAGYGVLESFGRLLGSPVTKASDEQRAVLHLAAVFTNNFTNHLLAIAHQLLSETGLPFELLLPLLRETLLRLETATPPKLQTGPALRGDHVTMERHLALLAEHPQWQELYRLLSKSIAELNRRNSS